MNTWTYFSPHHQKKCPYLHLCQWYVFLIHQHLVLLRHPNDSPVLSVLSIIWINFECIKNDMYLAGVPLRLTSLKYHGSVKISHFCTKNLLRLNFEMSCFFVCCESFASNLGCLIVQFSRLGMWICFLAYGSCVKKNFCPMRYTQRGTTVFC